MEGLVSPYFTCANFDEIAEGLPIMCVIVSNWVTAMVTHKIAGAYKCWVDIRVNTLPKFMIGIKHLLRRHAWLGCGDSLSGRGRCWSWLRDGLKGH